MKRPQPILRIRFELRGQALKNMAKIIATQEAEIAQLKFRNTQKGIMIGALERRIDDLRKHLH